MLTGSLVLWTIVKIAIIVGFVFNLAGVLTWVDRRQSAMIQDRVGPNRAVVKIGPLELRLAGLLHTLADGVKFFFKEDFRPPKADRLLFGLAPMLALAPVVILLAAVPFGDTVCPGSLWRVLTLDGLEKTIFPAVGRYGVCSGEVGSAVGPIDLQVAPLSVGILFVFAIAGQGIIAAAIAGVSSDNKFSLLGALRASSQMVSYEVTLGMSLIGAMMIYGSVRLDDMARWQGENAWGIFVQPVAFFLFFTAAVAESKRIPFDLPEAESELVSGYFTEYSGMKFGMFYLSEYMEIVTSSMLVVAVFLGGWQLPFLHRDGLTLEFGDTVLLHQDIAHIWMTVFGVVAFFGKVALLCWIQAFIRWSLPRFRYDQLMKLCWKVLLPLSLANIMITGVVMLALDKAGTGAAAMLKTLGHVSQATVAVGLAYALVRLVVWFVGSRDPQRWIVGSAATRADKAGGTKTTAMQA
jgi:NADH-quinone oxidoreductase subunit H